MPTRFDPRERLMASGSPPLVSSWLNRSLVRSVQYGSITLAAATTGTATITAVSVANSVVMYLGATLPFLGPNPATYARLSITNATTITATSGGNSQAVVMFVVIEFQTGALKSLQAGTISLAGSTPVTATVTSVNTNRAFLVWSGVSANAADDRLLPNITLTNSTTITAAINTTGIGTAVVGYQLAEFF